MHVPYCLAVTPSSLLRPPPPPPPLLNPLTPSPSNYSHPHCPRHHLAPTFTAQYHHVTPSPLTPFTPSPLHSLAPPHHLHPSHRCLQSVLSEITTATVAHSSPSCLIPPPINLYTWQPRWELPQIVPACLRSSIENCYCYAGLKGYYHRHAHYRARSAD